MPANSEHFLLADLAGQRMKSVLCSLCALHACSVVCLPQHQTLWSPSLNPPASWSMNCSGCAYPFLFPAPLPQHPLSGHSTSRLSCLNMHWPPQGCSRSCETLPSPHNIPLMLSLEFSSHFNTCCLAVHTLRKVFLSFP